MEHLLSLYVRVCCSAAPIAGARRRDERGDVPGWVLVTVMTAGLVMVIWGVAEDQLRSMLTTALSKVRQ